MSVKNAAYIAMMAVILCVCSWLTIPFTVPFTMQTFGVYCAFLHALRCGCGHRGGYRAG